MNYITRLQHQVAELERDKRHALESITDLQRYLTSSKFHNTTTEMRCRVEVQDVLTRLSAIKMAVLP